MIEPVSAISAALADLQALASAATAPAAPAADLLTPTPGAPAASGPSFAQALQKALGQVDESITHANTQAKAFAAGDQTIPLSDVMVSLEQANLALQMASGVRDKVVAAYTNIMNMQL